MTPYELAEIIARLPDDAPCLDALDVEWEPDDRDEYEAWLRERDAECADDEPW